METQEAQYRGPQEGREDAETPDTKRLILLETISNDQVQRILSARRPSWRRCSVIRNWNSNSGNSTW